MIYKDDYGMFHTLPTFTFELFPMFRASNLIAVLPDVMTSYSPTDVTLHRSSVQTVRRHWDVSGMLPDVGGGDQRYAKTSVNAVYLKPDVQDLPRSNEILYLPASLDSTLDGAPAPEVPPPVVWSTNPPSTCSSSHVLSPFTATPVSSFSKDLVRQP